MFGFNLSPMKALLLALLLLAPQELPEYGELSELRGKTKVFIYADSPGSRKLIASEIKKQFQSVDSPDNADFILLYEVKASTEDRGRQRSHYMRSQLTAYVQKERKRILWQDDETYEESGGFSLSRPNELNLAKNFLKALKKIK
jgi:hypothetical protein